MDQFWLELAKSSPTAAIIGLVVWWTMRDQGRILRSIDLRLAKVLERTRTTPVLGVPIRQHTRVRGRSRSDSDEDQVSVARTRSQDLEDGNNGGGGGNGNDDDNGGG